MKTTTAPLDFYVQVGALVGGAIACVIFADTIQGVLLGDINPFTVRTQQLQSQGTAKPVESIMEAISSQESGGDPTIKNKSGSGAMGQWQIMPDTLKLYRPDVSPDAFMASPDLQREVATEMMEGYWEDAIAAGHSGCDAVRFVASAWYSGNGSKMNSTAPQSWNGNQYPSIADYTKSVANKTDCQTWGNAPAVPRVDASTTPDDDVTQYFQEVAGGAEFGAHDGMIRRWRSPLRIAVKGSPTADDEAELARIADELRELTGLDISIGDDSPNVAIHFAPPDQFSSIEPNYIPGNAGFAYVRWDGNTITQATILISTTDITRKERSHLIREELTQSLGLLRDSERYPDSIFYQGWTDVTEFSDLDRAIIRKLYGG